MNNRASGAADNAKRAFRSAFQFLVGIVAAGIVTEVWNDYASRHNELDGTLKLAVTLVLASLVTYAQNAIEDATGRSLLGPTDRKAGDAVLGDGLGAKTGRIIGDTNPTTPTEYVERKAA